jgi:hypothetical protein
MNNETVVKLVFEFVHSDTADEFLCMKLETHLKNQLDWLETKEKSGLTDKDFQDFVDAIKFIRACITLLEDFSVDKDKYKDYLVAANKHSLKLESVF